MFSRHKNRSNLFQIVVSYLMIIIPLIMINAIIYYTVFVSSYEEEVSNVNKKSLLQIKMVVDNLVSTPSYEVFADISFDTKNIGYFDPIYYPDKVYKMWDIYKVHKGLLNLKKQNVSLFHSLGIYYLENEFINSKLRPDLELLRAEYYISIITGEKSLEAFDEFVEKWYKLGGDTLTKEADEWYSQLEK